MFLSLETEVENNEGQRTTEVNRDHTLPSWPAVIGPRRDRDSTSAWPGQPRFPLALGLVDNFLELTGQLGDFPAESVAGLTVSLDLIEPSAQLFLDRDRPVQ